MPFAGQISATMSKRDFMNTLYVVATPIGHLADISQRAITTLKEADVICVEDKRVSRVLLDHIGAHAELLAVHEHNEMAAAQSVISRLAEGKSVALISDAGTPGISDPGARLVSAVRTAGYSISPIPGASALAALMSVCGFADSPPDTPTLFEGFLPTKAGARDRRLKALAGLKAHLVFYEAPHRIVATCMALAGQLGEQRQCVVGRELTKRFEQIHSCKLGELPQWIQSHSDHQRGEFAIAIAAPNGVTDESDLSAITLDRKALVTALLVQLPVSQAVKAAESLAQLDSSNAAGTAAWKQQWSKGALYDLALSLKDKAPE